ncbi:MAG TPA: peptide chain release factor-like protein [Solirubrobacteraceae bacterium]|jgi:ribosome-associated protein
MSELLVVNDVVSIPLSEITLRASRSSGPGGQHANVTASRIEAVFVVGESTTLTDSQRELVSARCGPVVTAIAQDARSQSRNRELALTRLAERLDRALAVARPRRPTRPSAGARRRRAQAKQQTSARKAARRPPSGDDH